MCKLRKGPNENSAQSFSDRSFWKSLRLVDVRAFGYGCPHRNAGSPRVSRALTEVLVRDIRANAPRMSAGYPARKTSSLGCFFVPDNCRRLCAQIAESGLRRTCLKAAHLANPPCPLGHVELGKRPPPTAVKIAKIGKRGFWGQKTPISQCPSMGASSQKNPISLQGSTRDSGDFLTQSAHIWDTGKWEFFDPETLFSRFWRC